MLQKLYNPVLMKELKLRFRFFKSITGLMFYLLALCIVVIGFFMIVTQFNGSGYFRPSESFIFIYDDFRFTNGACYVYHTWVNGWCH